MAIDNQTLQEHFEDITIGYHSTTVSGNRARVGEYEKLDSGMEARFSLEGRTLWNHYYSIDGDIRDEDDQSYRMHFDTNRLWYSDISYQRFFHYLDHDPLTNQDSYTDFDAHAGNGIVVEEFLAENTIRIPTLPFLNITADYRSYNKRGHRQATTVSKCASCHVSSRNQRIDSSTNDVQVGAEAVIGPATLQYRHLRRDFREHGDAPTAQYGYGASSFNVRGRAAYAKVPDSTTWSHQLTFRTRLPFTTSLYSTYQWGERKNRDTHHDVDFSYFASRLSKYFSRYLSCDVFYQSYHMDSSVPDAIERDRDRGGIDVKLHMLKRTSVKLSYLWEDIDRDNFSEGSTRRSTYRLTVNRRFTRKLRLHGKFEKIDTDDPFVTHDNRFRDYVQTALPRRQHEAYLSLTWMPRHNLSLSSNFRYSRAEYDRYDYDEDRYSFSISCWYAPNERTTLTGAYTLSDTEIDTRSSYKTYHDRDLSSLLVYDEVPYDDRSQSWYLGATYRLTARLSLAGDLTYIRSCADFDTSLDTNNVGEYSDLEINRLETSIGATYLYTNRSSLYATFMFRRYNDREQNRLDGEFSQISVGYNYAF